MKKLPLCLFFFLSFITGAGILNANFYVKLLAFETILLPFLLLNILNTNKKRRCINISIPDLCIIGIYLLFLYYSIGKSDIINLSLYHSYFLLYISGRFCSIDLERLNLSKITIILISGHLLFCLLQYFYILPNYNSFFKIGSAFGNPDALGAYLAFLSPFLLQSKTRLKNILQYILLLLVILLFFALQARTAITAIFFAILTFFISKKKRQIHKYIIIIIIIIIGGLILLIYWHPISVWGRFYTWLISITMIIEKPLGWGIYGFSKYFPDSQASFTINHPQIANWLNYDIIHSGYNELLNIGVILGLPAIVLYIIFSIYTLRLAFQFDLFYFLSLLSYQIISFFYFPSSIIPLAILYIIFCTNLINNEYKRTAIILAPLNSKVLITTCLCINSFFLICNFYSYYYWNKAVYYHERDGSFKKSHEAFARSKPFLYNNGRFLISIAELYNKEENFEKKILYMKLAESYFSDITFYHNLAMLYEQKNDIREAKKLLIKATYMKKENEKITFSLICFLWRIGEKKEACRQAIILRKKLLSSPTKSAKYRTIITHLNDILHHSNM